MSFNVTGPDISPSVPIIPDVARQSSSSSLRVVGGSLTPGSFSSRTSSSTSSSASLSLAHQKPIVLEEGLRHANVKLDARQYRSAQFAQQLLDIINAIKVPSWVNFTVNPEALKIHKVSGSLTNAVYFVSSTCIPSRTLLLRIYGPSSGQLISRPRELHTLHVLSSTYSLGPRVYGTFDNGRVEQYFNSVTLTAADIRLPKISAHIGARMAELHCVDIAAVEHSPPSMPGAGSGSGWQIGAEKNVRSWLAPARHVLALPSIPEDIRAELDLAVFETRWEAYMRWLKDWERKEGASKRVFCHNDAQYGNLLKLTKLKEGTPEHHQIIVVDFEYASPNPAAFDIANHFHEWTADYHGPTPHILDNARYPTREQRRNFFNAYLEHCQPPLPVIVPYPICSAVRRGARARARAARAPSPRVEPLVARHVGRLGSGTGAGGCGGQCCRARV
ncbi:hypothetical protein EWM64_g281 [Hericium alpestre]|uniref:Choline kinase N-terminal domain-containing protein n=1 Tax=Hericium alpestre TaxID=135208 RepID=A0A4Z0ABS7_9AGAM|nr:hypothetical protein EWM64_g281 [Hericium alpestre]